MVFGVKEDETAKKIMKRLGTNKWNRTCQRLLEFMKRHDVKVDDVKVVITNIRDWDKRIGHSMLEAIEQIDQYNDDVYVWAYVWNKMLQRGDERGRYNR